MGDAIFQDFKVIYGELVDKGRAFEDSDRDFDIEDKGLFDKGLLGEGWKARAKKKKKTVAFFTFPLLLGAGDNEAPKLRKRHVFPLFY